jgi:hypothetical protein
MKKWEYKKALLEAGVEMNRLRKEVIQLRARCWDESAAVRNRIFDSRHGLNREGEEQQSFAGETHVAETLRHDVIAELDRRIAQLEEDESVFQKRLRALEVHRDRILHEMGVAQHDLDKLNIRVTTIMKEVIPKLKAMPTHTRASNAKKGK